MANYKTAHKQHPTGTVDSQPILSHLETLRGLGVGVRQIAAQAGVSARHVGRLIAGHLERLRPETAARLLAVRPVLAHGARIAGTKTHRYLDSLRREGFTQRSIAFQLGRRSQQLQLNPHVRVSSALKVSQLYQRLAGE